MKIKLKRRYTPLSEEEEKLRADVEMELEAERLKHQRKFIEGVVKFCAECDVPLPE
ncbi:hypothetical protein J6T66_05285 [bacterium]|nr:hypothetical protein [bacterium]